LFLDHPVSGTDMSTTSAPYIGRFAPSPTGALHIGSLLTAVASYCDAHAHQGKWLVRIEDIDPLREVAGASSDILHTLEGYDLHWHDDVLYQSQRHEYYLAALEQLQRDGHLFYCTCSRKQLAEHRIYPGTCHFRQQAPSDASAIKAKTPHEMICFDDALQGRFCLHFGVEAGDFVVRRKEGFFAYHLAVFVDDAAQGITDIVRGADLLDSTPYHLLLQRWLQVATPRYAHLPVLTNALGQKLSKQTFAKPLPRENRGQVLWQVLNTLGQAPDSAMQASKPEEILAWAVKHWDFSKIPHVSAIFGESLQPG
jgi:glutamyl-Q tRNA(Asp) synthetase